MDRRFVVTKGTPACYSSRLNGRRQLAEQRAKEGKLGSEEEELPNRSITRSSSVGMAMTYEGKRDRETGRILAERIAIFDE